MKMIKKYKRIKSIKMAVAFLCLLGAATFVLSNTVSTATESKDESQLSAFTGGDNESLLPESLRIVEEADFEGKAPLQVQFDSNQFVGPMKSYNWNFGDGEMAQGAVASHIFVSAGTYHVTLTTKEKTGQTHQKKILVNVEPKQ